MIEELVSIITPCYNGEKYLDTYFNDLLAQDYSCCELFFMDDGSTDHTREKFEIYKPLLEKKGFVVQYIYHENQGVGKTVADGIRLAKGEYIIWPDCDDHFEPTSISKRVAFMQKNPNVGLVRTEGIVVNENNPKKILRYASRKNDRRFEKNLFYDYVAGANNNAWIVPGCFMIRSSALDFANPTRYIYPTRRGQNWQILLPILYHFDCGFIEEVLCTYIQRNKSLSVNSIDDYDVLIAKQEAYIDIMINTIQHMNIKDEEYWIKVVKNRFDAVKLNIAFKYRNKSDGIVFYKRLKGRGVRSLKLAIKAYFAKSKLLHKLLDKKENPLERNNAL